MDAAYIASVSKDGIADRIKARRHALALTQAEVAKRGGFASTLLIAQYEQRVRTPGSYEAITGLCKALECSADYLLGLKDTP